MIDMKTKKIIILLVALALSASVGAKSLGDLWLSMPDSLKPILNKSIRLEFVKMKEMGVKAETKNLLGESCVMDTLSADYLKLSTSESSSLQIMLLPRPGSDSLLCVVETFLGPEKECSITFYDQHWKKVCAQDFLPADIYSVDRYFKAKPDTISEDKYQELHLTLEPRMWIAELSIEDKSLAIRLSLPLVSKEEKRWLNDALSQRKFKWNGRRFNEI